MDDLQKPETPLRQRPWDEGVRVPLPDNAGFTPQEHWAWARIIRGEIADMRFFPKDDAGEQIAGNAGADDGAGREPTAAEAWPAHRNLSAHFLRTILFHEPWASGRARPFVRIRCARVSEELDWENESFPGELGLYRCLFQSDANWLGLRIGRLLNLGGSRFDGSLRADELVVEASLLCQGKFSVEGDVSLLGARVGRVVSFIEANFGGVLNADRLVVEGGAFFRDCNAKADIRLLGARVGGNVEFDGACVEGTLQADGLTVDGSCFLRSMTKLGAAKLLRARIEGALQLSRTTVEGEVDLTGAEVKGELNLAQFSGNEPAWGKNARFVLRNATVGALAGGLDAFRLNKDFVPCDLAGFTYDRIGGLGAGAKGSTLASATGPDLRRWLRRCRPTDHFDPAPYRALAKALTDAGRADRAADVRNALGNYELVASGTPLMKRFMLALSWLFIGYGERNHRAFMWFVALVLIAAGVGYWQDLQWLPAGKPEGWRDWQAWRDWIGFAFGDAVPLVVFEESHKTFLADRFAPFTAPTGLTGFFYGVKVAGFVILSYLAAGLSGLAQHKE